VIRRTKKKQDKNPSIYEGSANPEYHNIQVKGKDPIPSKSKPTAGHQSPHPFRGKLVGEGDMEADREAGIKWVDNPDWKKLHDMDFKMVKDFFNHKENVPEAVGDSAKSLYDLQDELGLEDNILVDELARYLDVDQIADFVETFRRHHEMKTSDSPESSDDDVAAAHDRLSQDDPEAAKKWGASYKDEGIVGDIAKGAGRLAVKGAGKAAKGAGKLAFKGAKGAGKLAAKGAWAGTKIAGRGAMMGAKALAKAGSKKTTTHLRGGRPPGKIQDSKQLEKAPPGREKQVKALKGKVDNPYAVSWASYNKSKGKK
jgi:hypothetical protein